MNPSRIEVSAANLGEQARARALTTSILEIRELEIRRSPREACIMACKLRQSFRCFRTDKIES